MTPERDIAYAEALSWSSHGITFSEVVELWADVAEMQARLAAEAFSLLDRLQ